MTDKNLDKELMRRFKAEAVGRLTAAGMVFAVILLFGNRGSDMTKASVVGDSMENASVKQVYADSVRNVNALKFDVSRSRSK